MNYYKVLGVEENASKEEIKKAYEKQVAYFKSEVKDEKRLNKFLELFDEALATLNVEEKEIIQPIKEDKSIFDEEVSKLFKAVEEKEKSSGINEISEAIGECPKDSFEEYSKVKCKEILGGDFNESCNVDSNSVLSDEKNILNSNNGIRSSIKENKVKDEVDNTKVEYEKKSINDNIEMKEPQNINESYAATVILSREEIVKEALKENSKKSEVPIYKSKVEFESVNEFFNNDYDDDFESEDEYENDYIGRLIKNKKNKKKNNIKNKKENIKKKSNDSERNKGYNNTEKSNRSNSKSDDLSNNNRQTENYQSGSTVKSDRVGRQAVKNRANKVLSKEKSVGLTNILLIPFKILALPIIVILTLLSIICKVLSVSSWIVSKVIIIGAIAISAIHGYRIYTGQISSEYNIFVICAIGFVISIFLPSVLKVISSSVDTSNKALKGFVFG
ncbi:DnaJ domain-containing protein [Clostridium sp. 1001271B_151109_B4]|uniref:DnaJ domain-containing protein n=1 Tax=Clostridium sp. 1001271B_151109_B4 TaxID=2787148 RepID=UPI0018A8BA3F|nr:DnaJ domain-containing protein [Clostridium sp. 1001271B_151109_B4]